MKLPKAVEIIEVGPRDGLQNESHIKLLPREKFIDTRLNFVTALARSGLNDIEAGGFVRDDLVPQMAHTAQLLERLQSQYPELWKKKRFWCLVPNQKGLENALSAKAKHIAVFTATSESFNQRNIRMSVKESLAQIKAIMAGAEDERLVVRAYISTVWGCPYEGPQAFSKVRRIAEQLFEWGATEVSLGDTIGVATPKVVSELIKSMPNELPLAGHFHDTRGTALANTLAALDCGVMRFDTSAGGLGGCPYAIGASGNLATEDLIYMLDGMKIRTGIKLEAICQASQHLADTLRISLPSRYHQAWLGMGKSSPKLLCNNKN